MSEANFYLLLKNIQIRKANAISGPLTYGFPAISGFIGAIHRLNRTLQSDYPDITFDGVLIACNHYTLQTYRHHQYADYTFIQSRNPIKKDGSSSSFIAEGKIDLNVSLVIEVIASEELQDDLADDEKANKFVENIELLIKQQRIAGGYVLNSPTGQLFSLAEGEAILKKLQPAFILMDAQLHLAAITKELQTGFKHQIHNNQVQPVQDENQQPVLSYYPANPEATELDALLEIACLHHIPTQQQNSVKWTIKSAKQDRGWLVPIPIGYQGIYPPFNAGEMLNSRAPQYPHQYVETIYSLGQWVFPYRLQQQFEHCFWRYSNPQDNLYLYTQGESK